MICETFLLTRMFHKSKKQHFDVIEFKELLYDLNTLKKYERKIQTLLNALFSNKEEDFQILIILRSYLMDWEIRVKDLVAFAQKNKFRCTAITINPPRLPITNFAAQLYHTLVDHFLDKKALAALEQIIKEMQHCNQELYIFNNEGYAINIKHPEMFWYNLITLANLIERFYEELGNFMKYAWDNMREQQKQ